MPFKKCLLKVYFHYIAPVITVERSKNLENIIIGRIKDNVSCSKNSLMIIFWYIQGGIWYWRNSTLMNDAIPHHVIPSGSHFPVLVTLSCIGHANRPMSRYPVLVTLTVLGHAFLYWSCYTTLVTLPCFDHTIQHCLLYTTLVTLSFISNAVLHWSCYLA